MLIVLVVVLVLEIDIEYDDENDEDGSIPAGPAGQLLNGGL